MSGQFSRANGLRKEASSSQADTETYIEEIKIEVQNLCRRARFKIDTTEWAKLALDAEVEALDELGDEIWAKVRASERAAESKLSQAHDLQAAAQGRLSALARRCVQVRERLLQLEALAERRERTKEVSERCADEIAMHGRTIGKYDHSRFLPGGYGRLEARKQRFEGRYQQGDFAACSQDGPKLVEDLKAFADELTALIDSFLSGLCESEADMFVQRYYFLDGIADIAARFGLKENHVRTTLSRTRKKLKKYIRENIYEKQ